MLNTVQMSNTWPVQQSLQRNYITEYQRTKVVCSYFLTCFWLLPGDSNVDGNDDTICWSSLTLYVYKCIYLHLPFSGQKNAEQTGKMHGIKGDGHSRCDKNSCTRKPVWYASVLKVLTVQDCCHFSKPGLSKIPFRCPHAVF